MIYRVFAGYNTGGESIWKWHCDCETCRTTAGECRKLMLAKFDEAKKPQDTALYASLRR